MSVTEKVKLSTIQENISAKTNINLSHSEFNPANLTIIKRDGRGEKYDVDKMMKVCLWACDGNKVYADRILEQTKIKLYDKIKIADVFDEVIKTAVNNINRIYPAYEKIAAKLYLMKIYHDTWKIKDKTQYHPLSDVIKRGLHHGVYNKEIFNSYSSDEIDELEFCINIDNDYLFTYKSLHIFYSKYCLNYSKQKKLELPQHAYMRIAMTLFWKEEQRIDLIKVFYNYLASHYFTLATPIMINAGTSSQQLSSCVLSCMGDSADEIMNAIKDIAIYSKNKAGNAIDISKIRASGSYILGNNGFSSGPVPFLKILESTIKAFNQGATRPGACAVYYQWWHYDFEELIVLKNNTGTEENRARHLKYAVKINKLLIDRLLKNENVSLFSPHDVPKLIGKFGKEFEEAYLEYESHKSVKRKSIPARRLMEMLLKERVETGNIYLYHEENVNETSMLNRYINSSNLCTEITLPSRESKPITESLIDIADTNVITKSYETGEISLCNLASINLAKWGLEKEVEKQKIISILVRAMDNSIEVSKYPVLEGKFTNLKYRYLGIGVLNYTNYLAIKKMIIDSKEALEETHKIFDEWSYMIIKASLELAKEKGRYERFEESLWAKGDLPVFRANKKALKLTEYQPDINKWKELASEIMKHGLRNAQLMAIAPTATSGKAVNATESTEPIQHFFYKEDGKINLPTLVPDIKQNTPYYKTAVECDQYQLIKNAAVRQIYIDQAQSINTYFKKVSSLTEFTLIHLFGFALGIKTFYYCKTEKDVIDEICESCT